HTKCQAQHAKLEEERYEYMIRYSTLCDNDKQHRKKIDEQEILFDKMSRQLVEMNNNVLRLKEKILEKETKFQSRKGIINPDFEKINSPFQQTSSLKPYVPTVILEKIIIDLEDEVIVQICLWIIDSGCSKHMTGNRALLTNFVETFLGMVRFGNNDFTMIVGYGDVVIGSMTIKKSTCFVRNKDGVDLLTSNRSSNLYTISLNEVASNSSACLLEKASSSQSWLWNQRLSHLNLATINNLVKNNLVQGLPKMKFKKDHLCSACEQGKIHRKHHKSKTDFASNKPLYLLHMDLCGPMRVQSVNGKQYMLVVVDDYSRYTWVFFLHSKDEASDVIISFIKKTKMNLDILKRFGMENYDTVPTPMVKQAKLKLDLFRKPVNHTDYRSMIGSLMYVTSSRPDIMFATCMCVRYQENPNELHVSAVKMIFRYLKGTINLGLWYPKDSGFDLTAYSDVDHAGCHLDRKSTSGSVQFLGNKLMCWSSKKQNCVSISKAEFEYVVVSSCCAQVLWMRTQLTDYGFFYDKVPIYCDSKSAIAISCNPVQHTRTKHIDVRYHFIKDHVENGTIELYFVGTEYQLANLFTKSLPEARFKFLVDKLGMMSRET
nr:retrovirus-related Pol polyprotein from transposon TNT 1-94 [Tanacetum cinerariifolium]